MISSELTHENVSGLLVISDRHNANKLKQACCEYIRQHYSQVIETSQYREIRSEVEKFGPFFEIKKFPFSGITIMCRNANSIQHTKKRKKSKKLLKFLSL
jgi:hypothetical protein